MKLVGFNFFVVAFAAALLLLLGDTSCFAAATSYNVTSSNGCGNVGPGVTLDEAIFLANQNPGPDIIDVSVTNIDLTICTTPTPNEPFFYITESVTINFNGANVSGVQFWVTNDGSLLNPYEAGCPQTTSILEVVSYAPNFVEIGVRNADNSNIDVTINDLVISQMGQVAKIRDGATATFNNGSAAEIADVERCSRPTFEAFDKGNLALNSFRMFRGQSFSGLNDVIGAGFIVGDTGNLTVADTYIELIYTGPVIQWNSGNAEIVSTQIIETGGVRINQGGQMSVVNSVFYSFLIPTGQIQSFAGPNATLILEASTFWYQHWSPNFRFDNFRFPTNAAVSAPYDGSRLILKESSIHSYNQIFQDTDTLVDNGEGTGTVTADTETYIRAINATDAQRLITVTNQPSLNTGESGPTLPVYATLSDPIDIPYKQAITPIFPGGTLVNTIDGDLVFDGSVITTDVLGNPRTNNIGRRDIGAVQTTVAITEQPSEAPTDAPTESSPPTEEPTFSPTVTYQPTTTFAPTVTIQPTTTLFPTATFQPTTTPFPTTPVPTPAPTPQPTQRKVSKNKKSSGPPPPTTKTSKKIKNKTSKKNNVIY